MVGQDIVDQFVNEQIERRLRQVRAQHRRERQWARDEAERTGIPAPDNIARLSPERAMAAHEEARRAERQAAAEARVAAEAHNDRLGAAILKTLSKVKIDTRVIRILTAVDLDGELDAIAMRGARYGFPGWVLEQTTRAGKAKRVYVERDQALSRAQEYLSGATVPGEYAGRCLALVVMAFLADEDCVARSSRGMCSLHAYEPSPWAPADSAGSGLPWTREVKALVSELCLEALPPAVTARLNGNQDAVDRDEEPESPHTVPTSMGLAEAAEVASQQPTSDSDLEVASGPAATDSTCD
jgi:hypothetical protein